MSDRASFLRAIQDDPDDLSVRLVFADWLDEHGDSLAEFIRVQCELEPIRNNYGSSRAEQLRARERELLRKNRVKWLGKAAFLDRLGSGGEGSFTFRSGFPDEIALTVSQFNEHGAVLASCCPTLRKAVAFEVNGAGRQLAECEVLARFRDLEIADWITPGDARSLARSPHLRELRSLTVWLGNREQKRVCRAFAEGLPGLKRMELIQHSAGTRLNKRSKELVALVNEIRKSDVAHVHRPFEQLFPLRREVSYGILAGRLPGGFLGVVAVQYDAIWLSLAIFTPGGRFLREEYRSLEGLLPDKEKMHWEEPNKSFLMNYLREEFGFELDLIQVKEFSTEHGASLHLYDGHHAQYIDNPDELPEYDEPEDRRRIGAEIYRWLKDGTFSMSFGDSFEVSRFG